MTERTALINHLRALLLERGIVVAQGRRKLEDALGVFADEDDSRLSSRMRLLVEDLRAEWRSLDERIAAFDAEFVRMALIYGARAVLPRIMAQDTPLGRWARSLLGRAHKNIVVVALAAKLARIVWAVLRKEDSFDPAIAAA